MRESVVTTALETSIVGHVPRDFTVIEVREEPTPKPTGSRKLKRRRGLPRKGEGGVKEEKQIERHTVMDLPVMIADLPKNT